jgi:hypothetical protein
VSRRGYDDTDVFVGGAVVQEKAVFILHHSFVFSFNEDYIGDLADFFPFFFGGEDGASVRERSLRGIVAVEDGYTGAINEMVVGAIVYEDDSLGREEWRRTGFDYAGVEHARAAGE